MDPKPSIKQVIDLVALDYRRGRTDAFTNILIDDQLPFLQSVFEKLRGYGYNYEEVSSLHTVNLLRSKCQPEANRKINSVGWAKNVGRRIETAMAMYYGSQDLPAAAVPQPLGIPERPERIRESADPALEEADYVRSSAELNRNFLSKEVTVDFSPKEDLISELGLPGVLRDE